MDSESGETYEFLTTEFNLPPGVIAQLYRLRWDIEKFFDVCENLLAEDNAWGTGPTAAQVQNEFLVLVHNLLILMSRRLEEQEQIRDIKVDRKYEDALKLRKQVAAEKGRKVSHWVPVLRRMTRWSSQFMRWLQDGIMHNWNWAAAIAKLRPLMLDYMRWRPVVGVRGIPRIPVRRFKTISTIKPQNDLYVIQAFRRKFYR